MSITENNTQNYLYKYVAYNEYSLEILINQKLYLNSPDFLNDPFEGDFIINNYKSLISEFSIKKFLNILQQNSNCIIDDIVIKMKTENINNDLELFNRYLYEHLNKEIKKKYGTTSFSKSCDIIQMWSHYADSHKGFVIVFDKNEISKCNAILVPIKYNGLPQIEIDESDLSIKNPNNIFKNKLKDWINENEVRLVRELKGNNLERERHIGFPKNAIKGILYGERMSFSNIITIRNIIKEFYLNEIDECFSHKDLINNKIYFEKYNKKTRHNS